MSNTTSIPSESATAAVDLAFTQLDAIASYYGIDWPGDAVHHRKLAHDYAVMLDHEYLHTLKLQLIEPASRDVLYSFVKHFDPSARALVLSATADALPRVKSHCKLDHRLIFEHSQEVGKKAFERYLYFSYSPAEKLVRRDVHTGEDDAFSVTDEDLRPIVIVRDMKCYAFAQDLEDHSRVFVHRSALPPDTKFIPGQRYRAIIVHTAKGAQASSLAPVD